VSEKQPSSANESESAIKYVWVKKISTNMPSRLDHLVREKDGHRQKSKKKLLSDSKQN